MLVAHAARPVQAHRRADLRRRVEVGLDGTRWRRRRGALMLLETAPAGALLHPSAGRPHGPAGAEHHRSACAYKGHASYLSTVGRQRGGPRHRLGLPGPAGRRERVRGPPGVLERAHRPRGRRRGGPASGHPWSRPEEQSSADPDTLEFGRAPTACPTRRWSSSSAPPGPASPPGPRRATAREEIVSSDALRGVVGSGPHDLDASADAFALLERIVAARLGRGLTTVVDTLGLDDDAPRRGWRPPGPPGCPAVAVLLRHPRRRCAGGATPPATARSRRRSWPASSASGRATSAPTLDAEGWDVVHAVDERVVCPRTRRDASPGTRPATPERRSSQGLRVRAPGLAASRGARTRRPGCRASPMAADDAGLRRPRADGPPDPDPPGRPGVGADPGAVGDARPAGRPRHRPASSAPWSPRSRSGPPGITAKAAATLDALSGGRAFVGLGAGWWEREHAAYGLPFPPPRSGSTPLEARDRDDARAVGPRHEGVRRRAGQPARDHVVPAAGRTTSRSSSAAAASAAPCGSRARLGDAVNVRTELDRKVEVLRAHCRDVGRDPAR